MNTLMKTTFNPLFQLRRLYHWTMSWSNRPGAAWALGILSTVEGIFFPIPVDPFLLALSASQPKKSLKYAAIAAFCSVLGGSIGYLLGALFWEASQDLFFTYVMSPNKFAVVIEQFQSNAFLAVFLASFTPIPYKIFAIAGGVAGIGLPVFVLASVVGRSLRFFLIGILFYFWGASIRDYIEKHFNALSLALGFILIVVVLYFKF